MEEAPDPDSFVAALAPAVRQAAAVARALEGRVAKRRKPGEAREAKAALTIADSAAQEAILVSLWEHFPGVALEAEEDTPSVAHFPAEAVARVVIDPIDGTLHSYLNAEGPYATMVGLAIGDRFEAALVALPREGLFFDGVRGGAARRTRPRGEARQWRAEATGPRVLVSHETPPAVRARLETRGFDVVPACGGAISIAPLIPGVRAGLRLATGPGGISIRGRIGLAIARAAGALTWDERAEPFPEVLRSPTEALLIACDAEDLRALHWAAEAR